MKRLNTRLGYFSLVLLGMFLVACENSSSPEVVEAADPVPATNNVDISIDMDSDDIAGVVASENGLEAGVWVIAETDDFDTSYSKIVVTDDEGRYLLPDLPEANYSIWVRGYGLVDSAKVTAAPGADLDLTAVVAPDAASAALVYPCLLYTSPSPRDQRGSRMPSSA